MKYAIVLVLGSLLLSYLTASSVWSMFRPVTIQGMNPSGTEAEVGISDDLARKLEDAYKQAQARANELQDLATKLQPLSEVELLSGPPGTLQTVNDPAIDKLYHNWQSAQFAREFQAHYVTFVAGDQKMLLAEASEAELEARTKQLTEFKNRRNEYAQRLPATVPIFDNLDLQLVAIEKAKKIVALKKESKDQHVAILKMFNNREFDKCKAALASLKANLRDNGVSDPELGKDSDLTKLEARVENCLGMQMLIDQKTKPSGLANITDFLKRSVEFSDEPEVSLLSSLRTIKKVLEIERDITDVLAHQDVELLISEGAKLIDKYMSDAELRQKLRQKVLSLLGSDKGLREINEQRLRHIANEQEAYVETGPLFGQFVIGPNSTSYWEYAFNVPLQQRQAKRKVGTTLSQADFTTKPRQPTPLRLCQEYMKQRAALLQANSTLTLWNEFIVKCDDWDRALKELRAKWPPNEEPVTSVALREFETQREFAEKIVRQWEKFSRIVAPAP